MSDDTETGFVIDRVGGETWTWVLLDHNGDVLARAGRGYDSRQDAQVAIAATRISAREGEVPAKSSNRIG